jgi:hypothetical protein
MPMSLLIHKEVEAKYYLSFKVHAIQIDVMICYICFSWFSAAAASTTIDV